MKAADRRGRRIGGIGAMAVQLATRAATEVIGVCARQTRARLPIRLLARDRLQTWPMDRALLVEGDAPIDRVLDVVGGRETEQMGERVLRKTASL